jgi:hypothetical protein
LNILGWIKGNSMKSPLYSSHLLLPIIERGWRMTSEFQPIAPQLEYLMQVTVTLAPVLNVGTTAAGTRRIINITGGHFSGPKLSGQILPGGADWQLVRADGVAVLEARYTLQTADGALIYVQNRGLRHGPPEVLATIARGEAVDPSRYYMRTTPIFETGEARYRWLNDLIAVGSGIRRRDSVILDFYQVT